MWKFVSCFNRTPVFVFQVERIGYMYIVPIICSFGVILNLFTIVVLSTKGFQGPPVLLLKGLAAADIVTTAVTLPFGFAYCILVYFNACRGSLRKVMFSQASVCSRGGGAGGRG